jgi:prepilin-type N-terminal cleavage/methylation domain-containing protein/prepilin-type processing-associated H-X9-DG protein
MNCVHSDINHPSNANGILHISHISPRGGVFFRERAFTLLELLAVMAIIGVLGMVLLPALARSKSPNHALTCMNNGKQILAAVLLYAADNNDFWPPNEVSDPCWVAGGLDFNPGNPVNTDLSGLTNQAHSKLGAYVGLPTVYKCPADKAALRIGAQFVPRVRSVSMSGAVGTKWTVPGQPVDGEWLDGGPNPGQTVWKTYGKTSQMNAPTPANLFVIMDEHPDSINDAAIHVECSLTGGSAKIIDYPASYHDLGAGVSFADGHAEIHKWRDPRTSPPATYTGTLPLNVSSANNPDVTWLQQHTSALR